MDIIIPTRESNRANIERSINEITAYLRTTFDITSIEPIDVVVDTSIDNLTSNKYQFLYLIARIYKLLHKEQHQIVYTHMESDLMNAVANKNENRLCIIVPQEPTSEDDYDIFTQQTLFENMEVLSNNLKQSDEHKICIGKENNSTFVITNENLTWITLFKILLCHYEWHKDALTNPCELYAEFLTAYINNDQNAATDVFNTLEKSEAVKQMKKKKLAEVFKFNKKQKLNNLESEITNEKYRMTTLFSEYVETNKRLQERLESYKTISNMEENDNEEAIDFIVNNPYFTAEQYNKEKILMHYRAPIVDYDTYLAEQAAIGRDHAAHELINIFTNHSKRYQLWTGCDIIFNPATGYTSSAGRLGTYSNLLGHPHIDRYGCQGNHIDNFIEFINTGNIIGAINAITAMVMNLNFADGPVTSELIGALLDQYPNLETWLDLETNEYKSTNQIIKEMEDTNGTIENN